MIGGGVIVGDMVCGGGIVIGDVAYERVAVVVVVSLLLLSLVTWHVRGWQ